MRGRLPDSSALLPAATAVAPIPLQQSLLVIMYPGITDGLLFE